MFISIKNSLYCKLGELPYTKKCARTLASILTLSLVTSGLTIAHAQEPANSTDETPYVSSSEYLEDVGDKKIEDNKNAIDSKFQKMLNSSQEMFTKISNSSTKFLDKQTLNYGYGQDVAIWNSIKFGLDWRARAEPAYIGGYHLRKDSYTAKLPLDLATILDQVLPISLSINPDLRFDFWQYKTSAWAARNPLNGYTPLRFPFTAEKAQKLLKPGDLAHLRTNLSLNIGRSWAHELSNLLSSPLNLNIGVGYVLQGPFDVYIFKVDENRIHIRIAARREKAIGTSANLGFSAKFKIFGISRVDKKITSWFGFNDLLAAGASKGNQQIYLADYTVNLSYPEVRAAYDELFAKALTLNKKFSLQENPLLQSANPFNSRETVRKVFISNLSKIDDIYREDLANKDVGRENRRVDRNFSGTNSYKGSVGASFSVGLKAIFKFSNSVVRRDNEMVFREAHPDGSETESNFFYPTWNYEEHQKGLFNHLEVNTFRSTNIIYTADKNFDPTNFKSIGFYYDYTDKTYKDKDHQKILRHFSEVLPSVVNNELNKFLDAEGFRHLPNKIGNMRVSGRYFIDSKGLNFAENAFTGRSELEKKVIIRNFLIAHLDSIPNRPKALSLEDEDTLKRMEGESQNGPLYFKCQDDKFYSYASQTAQYYCNDIDLIATHLAAIIDNSKNANGQPNHSIMERHAHMDKLVLNSLFREVGPGFLFKLIPDDQLADATHFEIKFYFPNRVEPITFNYPLGEKYPERELYETILDIQNLMSDIVPDMRVTGKVDSLTTRKVN